MESQTPAEQLKHLLPKLFSSDRAQGERYLLFEITAEITAAIPLEQVGEATRLPATAITTVPQMPSWLLGWSNGRDRVFCVLSLGEFLGLAKAGKIPQQYSTIVVQLQPQKGENSSLLGLAVNRILRTVGIDSEAIMSPIGEFPEELTPYLRGYFQLEEKPVAVLDLTAMTEKIQSQTNSLTAS